MENNDSEFVKSAHKETIKVNDYGITITKGKKTKSASWTDVTEIKSTRTFIMVGRMVVPLETISIKTLNWKHKIRREYFKVDDLKELFLNIAEHAKPQYTKVIDGLDWLPDRPEFQKGKISGQALRSREHKILIKIGLVMLLIGVLLLPAIYYFDLLNSIWFAVPMVLLLFGAILSLAGGLSISEEKKKLKNK